MHYKNLFLCILLWWILTNGLFWRRKWHWFARNLNAPTRNWVWDVVAFTTLFIRWCMWCVGSYAISNYSFITKHLYLVEFKSKCLLWEIICLLSVRHQSWVSMCARFFLNKANKAVRHISGRFSHSYRMESTIRLMLNDWFISIFKCALPWKWYAARVHSDKA